MNQSLVLCKPDAVHRGLVGKIIARFEAKGLKIAALKMMRLPTATAEALYAEHKGKPFYKLLMQFMVEQPIVAMVVQGAEAPRRVRVMLGDTMPWNAQPGTIRGDWGNHPRLNLAHASDSDESAEREIPLFFEPSEILDYMRCDEPWLDQGD